MSDKQDSQEDLNDDIDNMSLSDNQVSSDKNIYTDTNRVASSNEKIIPSALKKPSFLIQSTTSEFNSKKQVTYDKSVVNKNIDDEGEIPLTMK